jgi:hypothetical protein
VIFTVLFLYKTGQVISPQSSSGGADLTADKAGSSAQEPSSQTPLKSMLVISGGEGYIDFRMGKSLVLGGHSRWRRHHTYDDDLGMRSRGIVYVEKDFAWFSAYMYLCICFFHTKNNHLKEHYKLQMARVKVCVKNWRIVIIWPWASHPPSQNLFLTHKLKK